jgi:cell division protein FtsQ
MSGDWKNILKKTLMGFLIAGVLTGAYLLGSSQRSKTRCCAIDVTIEDSLETMFVTEKAIREYLEADYKGLTGMLVDSIDLYRIENILVSRSPILSCEAYVTTEGMLKISVYQRKPSLKFQTKDYGFYSTADGFLLPLQEGYEEELLTVVGHIPLDTADCAKGRPEDPIDKEWLTRILKMHEFINSSKTWKERIKTLHCEPSGEITIRMEGRNEEFLFGHPKDIEKKFEKMQIYFARITADKGDDRYDVVDLRFKDQIVCRNTK